MKVAAESAARDALAHVLVCGHRRGLADALGALNVPFSIWHDRPVIRPGAAQAVFVAAFSENRDVVRSTVDGFGLRHPVTHVIAGNERAVVTASLARRWLGARKRPHTVSLRCHDKLYMKTALADLGVPMAEFVDGGKVKDVPTLLRRLGSPVVIKPRRESGGRGQEIIREPPVTPLPLRGRLAERFVDAPEASVESFVSGGTIVFSNVTEYLKKGRINVVPAELSPGRRELILQLNRMTLEGLRVRWGLSHLECFLTDPRPTFGELALRPPGGYIMELLALAYGFDPWKRFVEVELDRSSTFPSVSVAHAAAIVLHPGPGRVVGIEGRNELRRHPAVKRLHMKVRKGDVITTRRGTGHDVGSVLLRADTRRELLAAVAHAERRLTIKIEP